MARMTITVPDVGEGIAEVELVSWAVTEGQPVTRNQMIAEVMTDKATVEVPAPADGVVADLTGGAGDILLVGSPLFTLEVEGDAAPDRPDEATGQATPAPTMPEGSEIGSPAVRTPAPPRPLPAPQRNVHAVVTSLTEPPRAEGEKPTATPAVRRRARDAGIDLRQVVGSGPAGRITHEDLDAVFARTADGGRVAGGRVAGDRTTGMGAGLRPIADAEDPDQPIDQPIIGLRRKIAEHMVASASTIPHITYVEEVDMTALEELRATLNQQQAGDEGQEPTAKLTLLPFLVRALVHHLPAFPQMNAHLLEQTDGPSTLRTFGAVHVGIAAQTDGGLVVPVLRHAESESIWGAASRISRLAAAARDGTADREDLSGSTITITSLGPLGGLVTTPVINKPETTIIGVNKMVTRPVWMDGAFVPRKVMNLSSSFDHRVVDGWDAARFIQAVKLSLEQPALLFVDQV